MLLIFVSISLFHSPRIYKYIFQQSIHRKLIIWSRVSFRGNQVITFRTRKKSALQQRLHYCLLDSIYPRIATIFFRSSIAKKEKVSFFRGSKRWFSPWFRHHAINDPTMIFDRFYGSGKGEINLLQVFSRGMTSPKNFLPDSLESIVGDGRIWLAKSDKIPCIVQRRVTRLAGPSERSYLLRCFWPIYFQVWTPYLSFDSRTSPLCLRNCNRKYLKKRRIAGKWMSSV